MSRFGPAFGASNMSFGGLAGIARAGESAQRGFREQAAAKQAAAAQQAQLSGIQEGLSGLVSSYNQAFDAANAANEERYQQLLGSAGRESSQRAADIGASSQQNIAQQQQQLARSGLGGSTIGATLAQGAERSKQAELRREGDAGERIKRGIIERRTDTGPDPSLLASAFQSIGSGFGQAGLSASLKALGGLRL